MWLPGTTVTLTKNCYVDFALNFILNLAPKHVRFRLNCDMMLMLQSQEVK